MSKKQKPYALKNYFNDIPRTVDGVCNSAYLYHFHDLMSMIKSIFEFQNIPDTWDLDFLRTNLFEGGLMGMFIHNGNSYCLPCGLEGLNVYGKPLKINIANPVLGNLQKTINKDCELLYFNCVQNNFYQSMIPMITHYATLLAECDATLNTSLMNSRVAQVFYAENETQKQTILKMYDDVTTGKPCVVVNKNSIDSLSKDDVFMNVKNTYIGNDIILTQRSIINDFLTHIGINNANTTKRERLNADEVNSNNSEVKCLVTLWLYNMNTCFDRFNSIAGTNISVSFNKKIFESLGGDRDEPNKPDDAV